MPAEAVMLDLARPRGEAEEGSAEPKSAPFVALKTEPEFCAPNCSPPLAMAYWDVGSAVVRQRVGGEVGHRMPTRRL